MYRSADYYCWRAVIKAKVDYAVLRCKHTSAEELTTSDRSTIEGELRNYLAFGWFPEATGITGRDCQELLRACVDVVLRRDVVERYAVTNPVALRWMVRQLLGNAAGSFSINRFHADLKSQGFSAAKRYAAHLSRLSLKLVSPPNALPCNWLKAKTFIEKMKSTSAYPFF